MICIIILNCKHRNNITSTRNSLHLCVDKAKENLIHYIAKRYNSYNKTKGIRCTRNGLAEKTCYIDVICNMVKRKHETIPELCKTWNLKDKLLKFATRIYYPI